MASNMYKDISFRASQSGSVVIAKGSEYICNIATMLFNMVPGYDDYNPDMGLNISSRKYRNYIEGSRDTEYEKMIKDQFITYTDIIPMIIIARFENKRLVISMSVRFQSELYNVDVSTQDNNLATVTTNRINTGGI